MKKIAKNLKKKGYILTGKAFELKVIKEIKEKQNISEKEIINNYWSYVEKELSNLLNKYELTILNKKFEIKEDIFKTTAKIKVVKK